MERPRFFTEDIPESTEPVVLPHARFSREQYVVWASLPPARRRDFERTVRLQRLRTEQKKKSSSYRNVVQHAVRMALLQGRQPDVAPKRPETVPAPESQVTQRTLEPQIEPPQSAEPQLLSAAPEESMEAKATSPDALALPDNPREVSISPNIHDEGMAATRVVVHDSEALHRILETKMDELFQSKVMQKLEKEKRDKRRLQEERMKLKARINLLETKLKKEEVEKSAVEPPEEKPAAAAEPEKKSPKPRPKPKEPECTVNGHVHFLPQSVVLYDSERDSMMHLCELTTGDADEKELVDDVRKVLETYSEKEKARLTHTVPAGVPYSRLLQGYCASYYNDTHNVYVHGCIPNQPIWSWDDLSNGHEHNYCSIARIQMILVQMKVLPIKYFGTPASCVFSCLWHSGLLSHASLTMIPYRDLSVLIEQTIMRVPAQFFEQMESLFDTKIEPLGVDWEKQRPAVRSKYSTTMPSTGQCEKISEHKYRVHGVLIDLKSPGYLKRIHDALTLTHKADSSAKKKKGTDNEDSVESASTSTNTDTLEPQVRDMVTIFERLTGLINGHFECDLEASGKESCSHETKCTLLPADIPKPTPPYMRLYTYMHFLRILRAFVESSSWSLVYMLQMIVFRLTAHKIQQCIKLPPIPHRQSRHDRRDPIPTETPETAPPPLTPPFDDHAYQGVYESVSALAKEFMSVLFKFFAPVGIERASSSDTHLYRGVLGSPEEKKDLEGARSHSLPVLKANIPLPSLFDVHRDAFKMCGFVRSLLENDAKQLFRYSKSVEPHVSSRLTHGVVTLSAVVSLLDFKLLVVGHKKIHRNFPFTPAAGASSLWRRPTPGGGTFADLERVRATGISEYIFELMHALTLSCSVFFERRRIFHLKNELAEAEAARAEAEAMAATEREQAERDRAATEQAERERAERDRAAREKAERELAERERAEREKAEREKAEREKAEREQAERERAEREKAEREKAEREKAEREKVEREQAEQENAQRDIAEKEAAAAAPKTAISVDGPDRKSAQQPEAEPSDEFGITPAVGPREKEVQSEMAQRIRKALVLYFHSEDCHVLPRVECKAVDDDNILELEKLCKGDVVYLHQQVQDIHSVSERIVAKYRRRRARWIDGGQNGPEPKFEPMFHSFSEIVDYLGWAYPIRAEIHHIRTQYLESGRFVVVSPSTTFNDFHICQMLNICGSRLTVRSVLKRMDEQLKELGATDAGGEDTDDTTSDALGSNQPHLPRNYRSFMRLLTGTFRHLRMFEDFKNALVEFLQRSYLTQRCKLHLSRALMGELSEAVGGLDRWKLCLEVLKALEMRCRWQRPDVSQLKSLDEMPAAVAGFLERKAKEGNADELGEDNQKDDDGSD